MTYKKRFFGPADDRNEDMVLVILALISIGLLIGTALALWI